MRLLLGGKILQKQSTSNLQSKLSCTYAISPSQEKILRQTEICGSKLVFLMQLQPRPAVGCTPQHYCFLNFPCLSRRCSLVGRRGDLLWRYWNHIRILFNKCSIVSMTPTSILVCKKRRVCNRS